VDKDGMNEWPARPLNHIILEIIMNTSFKKFALRTLAVSSVAALVMSSANARVFFYGPRFVVAPVVAAPVMVAPAVVAAPVVVAPVYVPTCNFVSVPVVNAYTGWTYMVTRRVCN
jgi:hypothetical protein